MTTMQTESRTPNALFIADRQVDAAIIQVDDNATFVLQKHYNVNQKRFANNMLRDEIPSARPLGEHIVIKSKRLGQLIQCPSGLYALLSDGLKRVLYTSTSLEDFEKVIAPIDETDLLTFEGVSYNLTETYLTPHYKRACVERMQVPQENAYALLRTTLKEGTYICVTHDKKEYSPAHLFAHAGALVYVSLDFTYVQTIYPSTATLAGFGMAVRDTMRLAVSEELERVYRKEKRLRKKSTLSNLRGNLRIAQLDLDMYMTTSDSRREACRKEKNEILRDQRTSLSEWHAAADLVRQHAVALASFS